MTANPTPDTTTPTDNNDELEQLVDSLIPIPYPDYNMGLLPDETGYDALQEARNYNWSIGKEKAIRAIQTYALKEGRKMAEYAIGQDNDARRVFGWAIPKDGPKIVSAVNEVKAKQRARLEQHIKQNEGE